MFKKIFGFFFQMIKNVVYFCYCKRDKIQQGTEKLLNLWVYEIIALIGLIGGFFGIGFGMPDWQRAGLMLVGPLVFTFIINVFLIFNYFSVMKRSTVEDVKLHLPKNIRTWLKINAVFAFFIPLGIFAKGKLYRHYLGLYKNRQLPWASPDDSWSAKRKRLKEAKLEAEKKNKEKKLMQAQVKVQDKKKFEKIKTASTENKINTTNIQQKI